MTTDIFVQDDTEVKDDDAEEADDDDEEADDDDWEPDEDGEEADGDDEEADGDEVYDDVGAPSSPLGSYLARPCSCSTRRPLTTVTIAPSEHPERRK